MRSPELAAPAHAVVQAVHGVEHSVRAVVRVSVGDVEAEALLAAPLVSHEPIPLIVGQAVLFFQAAQRQDSVDWLEDDGSDHLRATDGARHGTKLAQVNEAGAFNLGGNEMPVHRFVHWEFFFFSFQHVTWCNRRADSTSFCISFSYPFGKDSRETFRKGEANPER